MEVVYSVDITAWTASFRYPGLISGVQPTLEVPPLSTILGLINAAAGRYLVHENIRIGYYCDYQGKGFDTETIYMIEEGGRDKPTNLARSNVLQREFLFHTFLRLYFFDTRIADFFLLPVYPLVLGRSGDLATVSKPKIRHLPVINNAGNIKGQIIPFNGNNLPGIIQALPQYFSDTIPRENLGTQPYSVIGFQSKIETNITGYRDIMPNGKEVDIYFHFIDTRTF